MATRLRDSPTLRLPSSANATTRRAAGTPGQPACRRSPAASWSAVTSPVASAWSATTTAAAKPAVRATSTTVRAGAVTGIPPRSTISSGRSGADRTCTLGCTRPPLRRERVTQTRPSAIPQIAQPCRATADTWLTTASLVSCAAAARTCAR
jgi:hypothetical protein